MHFPALLLLLGSALASLAELTPLSPTQRTCLTSDPDPLPVDKLARIPINAKATIVIDVIFHVIRASPTVGNPPRSALDAQIDVLNRAYGSANIHFRRAGGDRTTNTYWFWNGMDYPNVQHEMKTALRKGTYRTLNVYTLQSSDFLGSSTFPVKPPNARQKTNDGIMIQYHTLPGGLAPFDHGHTLTHEVGHWLNLLHTFSGGCSASGDGITDTPAEYGPAFGCPTGRDSCPGLPGLDPITNYMDYSDDRCMNNFTPQQRTRMRQSWAYYRAGP